MTTVTVNIYRCDETQQAAAVFSFPGEEGPMALFGMARCDAIMGMLQPTGLFVEFRQHRARCAAIFGAYDQPVQLESHLGSALAHQYTLLTQHHSVNPEEYLAALQLML
jgi:hypothetical protein